MIKKLKVAYGGGYRAGMSAQPVIKHSDGTKTIAQPACPYTRRAQFALRWAWESGWHEGMMKKLA